MTDLKNRGVRDILIACTAGLADFEDAVHHAFPHTTVQTSSVELGVGGNVPLVHSHRPGHDLCRRASFT